MSNQADDKEFATRFVELESRIQRIEEKMDRVLELLETDCKKMRDHIDFVENIYDHIKKPFHYLLNRVGNVPQITNASNHNI